MIVDFSASGMVGLAAQEVLKVLNLPLFDAAAQARA